MSQTPTNIVRKFKHICLYKGTTLHGNSTRRQTFILRIKLLWLVSPLSWNVDNAMEEETLHAFAYYSCGYPLCTKGWWKLLTKIYLYKNTLGNRTKHEKAAENGKTWLRNLNLLSLFLWPFWIHGYFGTAKYLGIENCVY